MKMTDENSDILAVLLDVKERNGHEIDDLLIKQCYELQKKHQYDPERKTIDKMRELVENNLQEHSS